VRVEGVRPRGQLRNVEAACLAGWPVCWSGWSPTSDAVLPHGEGHPNPAAALPQTASQAPTDYCDGLPFEALFAARDALFGPILVMQGASTRQVSGTVAIAAARLSNPASRARRGRMGGQVPVTSPPQVARGIASNSTAGFA
jgi:hypothetical protein